MKHRVKFPHRRLFWIRRPCRRLLLFPILNHLHLPLPLGITIHERQGLSAKSVREAAFRYNGVANFCGFLAALPANVSVFDPKLGRSRALVQGGQVIRKNVAWLRNRKEAARTTKAERVIASGQRESNPLSTSR